MNSSENPPCAYQVLLDQINMFGQFWPFIEIPPVQIRFLWVRLMYLAVFQGQFSLGLNHKGFGMPCKQVLYMPTSLGTFRTLNTHASCLPVVYASCSSTTTISHNDPPWLSTTAHSRHRPQPSTTAQCHRQPPTTVNNRPRPTPHPLTTATPAWQCHVTTKQRAPWPKRQPRQPPA